LNSAYVLRALISAFLPLFLLGTCRSVAVINFRCRLLKHDIQSIRAHIKRSTHPSSTYPYQRIHVIHVRTHIIHRRRLVKRVRESFAIKMDHYQHQGNDQYGFSQPKSGDMPSQYTIPGLGTPAPVGLGVGVGAGAFVPPPPPQFQNGQTPTITIEQLNAYAASMPPQFWSQFTSGMPGPPSMASISALPQPIPAEAPVITNQTQHETAVNPLIPAIQSADQSQAVNAAAPASKGKSKKAKDNSAQSPKSTRNSRRKKRASLLNGKHSISQISPLISLPI
jgi:hypothetical protein